MKKNILFASSMLFSFTAVLAQEIDYSIATNHQNNYTVGGNPLIAQSYEAEGEVYYFVSGCVPHSSLALYNSIHGGRLLETISITNEGTAQWLQHHIAPKLAANVANANIEGNNMVIPFGEKDFSIQKIAINSVDNTSVISWIAAVANPDDIYFEILKSDNKGNFNVVKEVASLNTKNEQWYNTTLVMDDMSQYKVCVRSKKSSLVFTSKILEVSQEKVSIYPTIFQNNINIEFFHPKEGCVFYIHNVQGQKVLSGNLSVSTNSIYVGNLAPASYFVTVTDGAGYKVVRELIKR